MDCAKKERKPILPLKTIDIIFRRRYLKNTQFYYTNRKHAVTTGEEGQRKKRRGTPFHVPRSEKLLSYIKFSDKKEKHIIKGRLAQPLHRKDNAIMAAARDIPQRLYVQEPPDDVKAVVEIHPEFYTVIEGRPLRAFDDIKVYCANIRSYAMNKQQIGYRRDLILKMSQNIIEENKSYKEISENLKQHVKNFQTFMTEDYTKACAKASEAEKMYQELQDKISEFLGYVTEVTITNNRIFKLDAIRNLLKVYRNYLMYVAPLTWRRKHDETLQNKTSIQVENEAFNTESGGEFLDIDKIVDQARIELKNPSPAILYFTSPEQTMVLFRTMELQSREYLTELLKMGPPFRMLQKRIDALEFAAKQDLEFYQYHIDYYNFEIEREIKNEKYFEDKFFRILNESFYNSVASPVTLKLKICIEYVYEQVFGKCDEGHQSLRDPMKILEVMYEEYNLKLDALDFKTVNQARNDFFAQDKKMMQDAYRAQRELRAFYEMQYAMMRAFEPPVIFKRPIAKRVKAKVPHSKEHKVEEGSTKEKQYKVSRDDFECLTLFTEWCVGNNPAPYMEQYNTYIKPIFDNLSPEDL